MDDQLKSEVKGAPADLLRFIGLGDLDSVAESKLDQQLKALPDTWAMLTTPVQFDSETNAWFFLNPHEFAYSDLHSAGSDVVTSVEVVGRPRVIVGSIDGYEPPPLPAPLGRDVSDGLLSVYLDAGITYDEVNDRLKRLVGRKYGNGLATAKIESIHVDGRGDVFRVNADLTGFPFSGTVYMLGGVNYDDLSKRMWVPTAVEDAEKGLRFHAAGSLPGWLVRSALKDEVNAMLSWNVAPLIDEQLDQLSSSFDEATEQRLRLEEHQIHPRSVFATDDALRLYLEVEARVVENQ